MANVADNITRSFIWRRTSALYEKNILHTGAALDIGLGSRSLTLLAERQDTLITASYQELASIKC